MKLSIVSDEISLDFREAISHGISWEIRDFELRNLITGRVPYITKEELDQVYEVKNEFEINISAISPGLFNISLQQEEQLKHELEEKIYESFRFADNIGTRDVIISSFRRYPKEPEHNYIQVLHILRRMATLAEKYGFQLLIQNQANYWCDTAENMAKILENINSGSLLASWNPGNAYAAGEIPYPYGFLTIRNFIHTMHVKDARKVNGSSVEWATIGNGEIDWMGQFQALMHGVDLKYITIETSIEPLIENSKINVDQIYTILKDYSLDENDIIR